MRIWEIVEGWDNPLPQSNEFGRNKFVVMTEPGRIFRIDRNNQGRWELTEPGRLLPPLTFDTPEQAVGRAAGNQSWQIISRDGEVVEFEPEPKPVQLTGVELAARDRRAKQTSRRFWQSDRWSH